MGNKHIFHLTDDTGLLSKSNFCVANRRGGYLTYENALAFIATFEPMISNSQQESYNLRYLAFIVDSFLPSHKSFAYKMNYQREWITINNNHHLGFLLWAFGLGYQSHQDSLKQLCKKYFFETLQSLPDICDRSVIPFILIGISNYLEVERIDVHLIEKAKNWSRSLETMPITPTITTIASSYSLLLMAEKMVSVNASKCGLEQLETYITFQLEPEGHFAFASSRDEKQYPFECLLLTLSCLKAFDLTKQIKWKNYAELSHQWFLGKNNSNKPLIDSSTHGCADWITLDDISLNQSALSSISWSLSLNAMKSSKPSSFIPITNQLEIASIPV